MENLFKLKELEYPNEITVALEGDNENLKNIKDIFFHKESGTHQIIKTINNNIDEILSYSEDKLTKDDVFKLNLIVDQEKNQQVTFIKAEENDQFEKGIFYLVADLFGPMPVYTDLNNPEAQFDLTGMFKKDGGADPFKTIQEVFPTTIEFLLK